MLHRSHLSVAGLAVTIAFGIVGCSSDGTTKTAYTGKTTAATISTSNSKDLAKTTIQGNKFADPKKFNMSSIGKMLAKSSGRAADETGNLTDLLAQLTQPTPGDCGGTMQLVYDQAKPNDFEVSFNNYCEYLDADKTQKNTQDGSFKITANSDTKMTFTISLTTVSPDEDSTVIGSMVMEELSSTKNKFTMNIESQDRKTNEGFKAENFSVTEDTSSTGSTTSDISGRMYEDDSGYVDISTPTPLAADANGNLTAGKMVVSGAGSGTATLEINGSGYTIKIDADGDGTAEETVTGTLAELNAS